MKLTQSYSSIEICAGAGGQALGLEQAGFEHEALIEIDVDACRTLKLNRPNWNVLNHDLREFHAFEYKGVDLLAGGVPCPPFSKAGLQLGDLDDRNMFPEALRLVRECEPRAVMLENVRGLLDPIFAEYRASIDAELACMGYKTDWKLLHASHYGVPQLRPRVVCVALREDIFPYFRWPEPSVRDAPTVGEALRALMAENGWEGAHAWAERASNIAPTLVGGSKKHGGPDLGPSRARTAWAQLGVNGKIVAAGPPPPGFSGAPTLTVQMAAVIQGFPTEWRFFGRKTTSYRQVGNAFPPPVAFAVGRSIACALELRGRLGLCHAIDNGAQAQAGSTARA